MELNIQHDEKNQRFYVKLNNEVSELKYKKMENKILDYYITFVPETLRGQGIAAKLADYALQYAKHNHYQIIPTCSYVKKYIDDHPIYQNLVKNAYSIK